MVAVHCVAVVEAEEVAAAVRTMHVADLGEDCQMVESTEQEQLMLESAMCDDEQIDTMPLVASASDCGNRTLSCNDGDEVENSVMLTSRMHLSGSRTLLISESSERSGSVQ